MNISQKKMGYVGCALALAAMAGPANGAVHKGVSEASIEARLETIRELIEERRQHWPVQISGSREAEQHALWGDFSDSIIAGDFSDVDLLGFGDFADSPIWGDWGDW